MAENAETPPVVAPESTAEPYGYSDLFYMFIELLSGTVYRFCDLITTYSMDQYLWFAFYVFLVVGILLPALEYIRKRVELLLAPVMFSYQHVLITGCSSGLGRSLVQKILHRGAIITMICKDKDKLQ